MKKNRHLTGSNDEQHLNVRSKSTE